MAWTRTGVKSAELPNGAMRDAQVNGTAILLLNLRGQIAAFQGRCPHEEGVLADGTLENDRVVCPLHGATFEVPSGTIVADPDGITPPSGDVPSLRRFPVRVADSEIEVDVP
jgi:nitrite reductase/ring-hydroxylating ferredoxin subunit